jgi:uncharacterized protein involved in cysteine biosynthesis
MDWAQVLVIILSLFLAIFLLLGIVLIALLIKVTRQIKAVTDSARTTAEHIEHAVAGASKVTSPVFLMQLVSKQLHKFKTRKEK